MTQAVGNTPADDRITQMFRELDALKAAGKDSSEPGSEYMNKLYELKAATSARISNLGLVYL